MANRGPERIEDVRGRSRFRRERVGRYEASEAETGDKTVEAPAATVSKEHNSAEQRLGAALAEQHRSSDRYDAATGKPALVEEVALHAADQEVAARDAWLRWVDDEHYHGLNAGPFELFAEDSER